MRVNVARGVLTFLIVAAVQRRAAAECPPDKIEAGGVCKSVTDAFVFCIQQTSATESSLSSEEKKNLELKVGAEVQRVLSAKGDVGYVKQIGKKVAQSYKRGGYANAAAVNIVNQCIALTSKPRPRVAPTHVGSGTGTLVLNVTDKYSTDKTPSDVTCTTKDGRSIRPPHPIELPVGPFMAICSTADYLDETISGEVRTGPPTLLRVQMEQKTGTIRVIFKDTDGELVMGPHVVVDGRRVPGEASNELLVRDLPARIEAHVTAPERTEESFGGTPNVEMRWRKWGEAKASVMVRGGVETPVPILLPILERRDRAKK